MQPREPNRDDIAVFVDALFRYAEDGAFVSLRGFDQFDAGRPAVYVGGVRLAGLDPVIEAAVKAARYCANTTEPVVFAPPIATFTAGNKATEQHLANGVCISVELDAGIPPKPSASSKACSGQQPLSSLPAGPATIQRPVRSFRSYTCIGACQNRPRRRRNTGSSSTRATSPACW
jgi:hypothetical protein